jgi:hypothetical protein
MEKQNENLRDRLLARLPQPENLRAYRDEVASALARNEEAFRREKWGVGALWIFAVGLSTVFLWLGAHRLDTPKGPWFGILACFVLLYPLAEVLKHFINRSRVEILKEVKQVQLQVLELQALLRKDDGR